jgi:CRISPR-associated endonuclease Cas3-HD
MKGNNRVFKCPHNYGCTGLVDCKLPSFYEGKNGSREPKECFVQHIELLLNTWINRLELKYLPSILRICKTIDPVMDSDALNSLIKAVMIFHDVGKLTDVYKAGRGIGDFRHEFVSSYVFSLVLEKLSTKFHSELKTAAIGAVLLHHEPILMGQVGQIHEEKLTATEVWRRLNSTSKDKTILLERADETINRLIKGYCGWEVFLPQEIVIKELAGFLQQFLTSSRHLGRRKDRIRRRILVGAFLSPLVVCDYAAAVNFRSEDKRISDFWKVAKSEVEL